MTYNTILDIFTLISPFILLVGSLIGFLNFQKLNITSQSITIYLTVMLCVDVFSRILEHLHKNNTIVLPIYCLIELALFTYFYDKYFLNRRYITLVLTNIIAIIYIVWDIFTFSFTSIGNFQSYAKVFDNFGIILLALTYLYEKLDQQNVSKWKSFRLNIVILVFFTINLILFLPYNFIINNNGGIQFIFWQGILFSTVIFYIYLTYYIWENLKNTQRTKNI